MAGTRGVENWWCWIITNKIALHLLIVLFGSLQFVLEAHLRSEYWVYFNAGYRSPDPGIADHHEGVSKRLYCRVEEDNALTFYSFSCLKW